MHQWRPTAVVVSRTSFCSLSKVNPSLYTQPGYRKHCPSTDSTRLSWSVSPASVLTVNVGLSRSVSPSQHLPTPKLRPSSRLFPTPQSRLFCGHRPEKPKTVCSMVATPEGTCPRRLGIRKCSCPRSAMPVPSPGTDSPLWTRATQIAVGQMGGGCCHADRYGAGLVGVARRAVAESHLAVAVFVRAGH